MNLPDPPEVPGAFRRPTAAERPFAWRLEGPDGAEVAVDGEWGEERFLTQSDAESWVGEFWRELAEAGVAAVTLLEGDRTVYGPMSLEA